MGLARPLPKGVAAVLVRLTAGGEEDGSSNSISTRQLATAATKQLTGLGGVVFATLPLLFMFAGRRSTTGMIKSLISQFCMSLWYVIV
jgi:hypothetical protein